MNKYALCVALLLTNVTILSPVSAEKVEKHYIVVNEAVGVPVFPDDILDRPYIVIGEIESSASKATIFSQESSQKKIYENLWKKAEKLGADAVINAKYGDSHVTAFSWGKTNSTGTAIKFKPVEAAEAAPTAPVSEVQK